MQAVRAGPATARVELRAAALSGQARAYWFDRFVRNAEHGRGLVYRGLNNKNRSQKPGEGALKSNRDYFFGYIPNYYAMEERAMLDRKTLEVDRIRPPCGEIPDVRTFLERADVIDSDLTAYEDSFSSWDDLMTSSYMEMVYKKKVPAAAAHRIFNARELYNSGHVLHRRPSHAWREWAKKRGNVAPFPENYYPHMRIAKYREVMQETQTTGHKVSKWERMRMKSG
ncbi:hypothetical protein DIPPA_11680 [Diplonema papillatum]|nr:hypothetical protein DIPPA_11680 [Diplonema papillatum]